MVAAPAVESPLKLTEALLSVVVTDCSALDLPVNCTVPRLISLVPALALSLKLRAPLVTKKAPTFRVASPAVELPLKLMVPPSGDSPGKLEMRAFAAVEASLKLSVPPSLFLMVDEAAVLVALNVVLQLLLSMSAVPAVELSKNRVLEVSLLTMTASPAVAEFLKSKIPATAKRGGVAARGESTIPSPSMVKSCPAATSNWYCDDELNSSLSMFGKLLLNVTVRAPPPSKVAVLAGTVCGVQFKPLLKSLVAPFHVALCSCAPCIAGGTPAPVANAAATIHVKAHVRAVDLLFFPLPFPKPRC